MIGETTLSEQVKAEALANGYRREAARQTGSTVRGVGGTRLGSGPPALRYGSRFRELAAELEQEEAARRRADLANRLDKSPSGLIATALAEWPEQSAAVRAYADAEGRPLGEVWKDLIDGALTLLRNGGGK